MDTSDNFWAARVFLDELNVRAFKLFEERAKKKVSSSVQYISDRNSSTKHSAEAFLEDVTEKVISAICGKLSLLPSVSDKLTHMEEKIGSDCESHRETIEKGGQVSSFISSGWSLEQTMNLEDETVAQKTMSACIARSSLPAEFEEVRLSNIKQPFLKNSFEGSKGKSEKLQQDSESQLSTITTTNKLSVSLGPFPSDSDMQLLTEDSDKVTFKPARELLEAISQEEVNLSGLPSPEGLSESGQFNYFTGDSSVSPSLELHATSESHSCRVVESHRESDIESIKKDISKMKDDGLDANIDLGSFVQEEDQAVPGEEDDINIEKTRQASLYDLNVPTGEKFSLSFSHIGIEYSSRLSCEQWLVCHPHSKSCS